MEFLDGVIKVGSAISAISLIGGGIAFFVRLGKKITSVGEDIKTLKDHSHENYLGIKRLTVMSHDMPIGERIIAGNDYIKAGGNGEVKQYIENELHTKEVQKD